MFESNTALPHLLPPEAYTGREHYQRDLARLAGAWHLVGTEAELARPGDFLTTRIAGCPIQVRNFSGNLVALSNVCAHRHALICSETCGNSAQMRCQYHGWEYRADGSTGKIPQPKNFVPFPGDRPQLTSYRIAQAGQLVFVNLDPQSETLDNWLGNALYDELCQRFSSCWHLALRWNPEFSANWKVPIENSLESYHVPSVHPNTFRDDPGPTRSKHTIKAGWTAMETSLPFSPHNRLDATFQQLEHRFIKLMGYEPTGRYQQHHVFPHLLFSFTDALSLVTCVQATAPDRCRAVVRQFGRLPKMHSGWRAALAKFWSRMAASITKRILREDQRLFAAIQEGLESSEHEGILGICEERIFHFQEYWQQAGDRKQSDD